MYKLSEILFVLSDFIKDKKYNKNFPCHETYLQGNIAD